MFARNGDPTQYPEDITQAWEERKDGRYDINHRLAVECKGEFELVHNFF